MNNSGNLVKYEGDYHCPYCKKTFTNPTSLLCNCGYGFRERGAYIDYADLLSARQTIAEQGERIKWLEDYNKRLLDAHVVWVCDKCGVSFWSTKNDHEGKVCQNCEQGKTWLLHDVQKQTIANLTTERNAWREDAEQSILLIDGASNTIEWWQKADKAIDHHRQLHERYPTEKSDTAKGE